MCNVWYGGGDCRLVRPLVIVPLLLAPRVHVHLVHRVEGGVVYLVLGGGVLEVEQVHKAVAPQHLVGQVRGLGL